MLTQLQRWARRSTTRLLAIVLVTLIPVCAFAQDEERSSILGDVLKGVVLDPTTYAPAIIAYDGTSRDWKTSQPLFRAGFVEHNSRFTISGLPNDVLVSYSAGNRRILADAFANLQISIVNNVADRLFERVLIERYPEHRKLLRTLSWVERISFASFMAYRLSAAHYQQAQLNQQLARTYGLK